jgi:competence protein ComGC
MDNKHMRKNQQGFSALEVVLLLMLVFVLVLVGWRVYDKQTTNKIAIDDTGQSGQQYKSKNYTLSLSRTEDNDLRSTYSLNINFNDSFDPQASCPAVQAGFADTISATNVTDKGASITITQNEKPYSLKSNSRYTAMCPDVVVPLHLDQYTFDNNWLENSHPTKTLTIQGKKYSLQLDKNDYKLTLTGGNVSSIASFIPDGLGGLYVRPVQCMTADALKSYAASNGMELAETKYPGINQKMEELIGPQTYNNPYDQNLLVIGNDYFKNLLKQTGENIPCQVWASANPVGGNFGKRITVQD